MVCVWLLIFLHSHWSFHNTVNRDFESDDLNSVITWGDNVSMNWLCCVKQPKCYKMLKETILSTVYSFPLQTILCIFLFVMHNIFHKMALTCNELALRHFSVYQGSSPVSHPHYWVCVQHTSDPFIWECCHNCSALTPLLNYRITQLSRTNSVQCVQLHNYIS